MNEFTWIINGLEFQFVTCDFLFSPTAVDRGTSKMIELADKMKAESPVESMCLNTNNDLTLDLGCGYGVVGIYFAKLLGAKNVVMSDVNPVALEYAKKNAILNGVGEVQIIESDGFKNINLTGFKQIFVNPPYHVDFSVPKHFIEKGFNRLAIGGKMHMVTKRKDWYKNKLTSIFGGVKVVESDGYYLFCAEKRQLRYGKIE